MHIFCLLVYLEVGRSNSGGAGTINFGFGSATTTRTYQFKVTYYDCNSPNRYKMASLKCIFITI